MDSCYSGHWQQPAQSWARHNKWHRFLVQTSSLPWQWSWNSQEDGSGVFIDVWSRVNDSTGSSYIGQIASNSDINYMAGTLKVRGDSKQIPSFYVGGVGTPVVPFYFFGVDFRMPISQERNEKMSFYPSQEILLLGNHLVQEHF